MSEVKPAAWMYQVRFTDPPDSEWRYYGLYRSKSQADAMVDRHDHAQDIEGRLVPLYPHLPKDHPPMTDDEIDRVTDAQWAGINHKPIYAAYRAYARAIEDALRERK